MSSAPVIADYLPLDIEADEGALDSLLDAVAELLLDAAGTSSPDLSDNARARTQI